LDKGAVVGKKISPKSLFVLIRKDIKSLLKLLLTKIQETFKAWSLELLEHLQDHV
jgi:hypothetical protein